MLRRLLYQYVDAMVLRRQMNLNFVEKLVFSGVTRVRPRLVASWREHYQELIANRRVAILSPSDGQPDLFRRLQDGDYWAQYELTKALGELGYPVMNIDPDVVIHLFGAPVKLPRGAFRIIWIYSHPELVTAEVLGQYDRIFCLSSQFIQRIREMGFDAEWAPGATARVPRSNSARYDIVFVANPRPWLGRSREVIQDLGDTRYNLKVWGNGWDKFLPERYIGGEYFDYTSLGELYSSALISLCDHSPEMRREGFVALRVFDILASGGFCISDANPGIEEIFGDAVPQYRSPNELRELIDFYIQNPDERLKHMQRGQEIALSHSWHQRVSQFTRGLGVSLAVSQGKHT